jgi:hypothetical protein
MTLRKWLLIAVPVVTSLGGCSDASPLTARGAVYADVIAPSVTEHASKCLFGPHAALIGGDAANRYPNQFRVGARVVDGEGGASVSCSVKGSTTFSISGTMTQGAVNITVNGTTPATAGETGEAKIYIRSSQTVGQSLAPATGEVETCTLTPVEVAPGRAWSKFDCSLLKASGQLNTYCGATGFFVFENCDQ